MKRLHISDSLSLPLDMATSTAAIIAIRGAGKSYTAAVMAEEMIENGIQTVIVDPTGAWWGLRSSADGKKAGLPVIVMGGNHGDVPLEESAGEVVAQFVVESGASVILDLSLMRKNAQKRFMADFAETLYHLKGKTEYQTPLHVYLDEGDRFAPQKPQPEHARLLGAIEDIVRLGRTRGFGITTITQRAAVLNKDVLTQTETLIVLRTTSPQDRKAMMEWVSENATEEEADKVVESLSSLPNGTAWVWSPSFLKILKKVEIRTRRTFNSSATPKVGEKRIEPKVLAPVDLDVLKGRIVATIEKAKANDPKALRLELSMTRTLLAEAQAQAARNKPHVYTKKETVEVNVVKASSLTRVEALVAKLDKLSARTLEVKDQVIVELRGVVSQLNRAIPSPAPAKITARAIPAERPVSLAASATSPKGESGDVPRGARRILEIVASKYHEGISRTQVATLTGIKPGGSTFTTYIGILRRLGLIEESGDGYVVTAVGREKAGSVERFPTGRDEVLRLWSPRLAAGARKILESVVNEGPIDRSEIGAKMGINPSGSTITTYLGILKRNGLIVYDGETIKANSEVFS